MIEPLVLDRARGRRIGTPVYCYIPRRSGHKYVRKYANELKCRMQSGYWNIDRGHW